MRAAQPESVECRADDLVRLLQTLIDLDTITHVEGALQGYLAGELGIGARLVTIPMVTLIDCFGMPESTGS